MNTLPTPPNRARVLLIDDDRDVHHAVAALLDRAGIDMLGATSPDEAFSMLGLQRADVILLDLNFTRGRTLGEEGFAALTRLLGDDPAATVVVVTGHSGVRIAVAAMRAGAFDFVMKPWRNDEFLDRVRAAIAYQRRRDEIAALADACGDTQDVPRLLGASAGIEQVRDLVRRVAPTRADVLVTGPSGSGRSLVARLIHHSSARTGDALVALEGAAAADPQDVAAVADLEAARGGTLLLRHVDQLSEAQQARLVERLPQGPRIIATALDAESLSPALKRRIATVEIAIPPLSRRSGDALVLARHFARVSELRHGRPVLGFGEDAEALIAGAIWPDDVRGLAQAVERAVVLSDGGPVGAADLGLAVPGGGDAPSPETAASLSLERSERSLIQAALKRHGFNISHAAEDLGLSRAALYRRINKHGL